MEPTTERTPPEQQRLAFERDAQRPEQIEQAEPTVSSDPNLYSAEPLKGFPPELDTPPGNGSVSAVPLWLQRVWLVVYVIFCIELGMLLAVLPWTQVWTKNALVADFSPLRGILESNFVRGLVTGLGIVDIWLGVSEAVHYRERKQ